MLDTELDKVRAECWDTGSSENPSNVLDRDFRQTRIFGNTKYIQFLYFKSNFYNY